MKLESELDRLCPRSSYGVVDASNECFRAFPYKEASGEVLLNNRIRKLEPDCALTA
jgi:hypothetical protein